jgi:hypothetical protein
MQLLKKNLFDNFCEAWSKYFMWRFFTMTPPLGAVPNLGLWVVGVIGDHT